MQLVKVKNYTADLVSVLKHNKDYFTAIFVAFSSLIYFLAISYPDFFSQGFVSLRFYGVVIFCLNLLITLVFSFTAKFSFFKSFSIFVQSNLLTFYSFIYFITIDSRFFYPFLASFLAVLIFLVNLELFSGKSLKLPLLIPQVIIFSVQTFSFIQFIALDRLYFREFHQDLLRDILLLDPSFWVFFSSLALTLISALQFNLKPKQNLSFSLILFVLFFQIFYVVNTLGLENFLYWQKTILFLIFWNFIFKRFRDITDSLKNLKNLDSNFWHQTYLSTVYHGFLICLVFFSSF